MTSSFEAGPGHVCRLDVRLDRRTIKNKADNSSLFSRDVTSTKPPWAGTTANLIDPWLSHNSPSRTTECAALNFYLSAGSICCLHRNYGNFHNNVAVNYNYCLNQTRDFILKLFLFALLLPIRCMVAWQRERTSLRLTTCKAISQLPPRCKPGMQRLILSTFLRQFFIFSLLNYFSVLFCFVSRHAAAISLNSLVMGLAYSLR